MFFQNNRFLKSIADDEVINMVAKLDVNVLDTVSINDKKATCKMDNYILLIFLLITTLLTTII